jgi:hypothetical protein
MLSHFDIWYITIIPIPKLHGSTPQSAGPPTIRRGRKQPRGFASFLLVVAPPIGTVLAAARRASIRQHFIRFSHFSKLIFSSLLAPELELQKPNQSQLQASLHKLVQSILKMVKAGMSIPSSSSVRRGAVSVT